MGQCWWNMIDRCCNPKSAFYRYYGERGISVCERWRISFQAFLEDMAPHPGRGYSIDRINNAGDDEPNNCRWAAAAEQAINKRAVPDTPPCGAHKGAQRREVVRWR
jgi:hypothetical protein